MTEQNDSSPDRTSELQNIPIDLGLFRKRGRDLEDLVSLIISDSQDSHEYERAAAFDLLTACMAFTCEFGCPRERTLATPYKLCKMATSDQLPLTFAQIAGELHCNGRTYVRTMTFEPNANPNSFAVLKYKSLIANCSRTLMEKAHKLCISELEALVEERRDSFIRAFDERFASHRDSPTTKRIASQRLDKGFTGLITHGVQKAPLRRFQLISFKIIEETAPGRARIMSSQQFREETRRAPRAMLAAIECALENGDTTAFGTFSMGIRSYRIREPNIVEQRSCIERTWASPEDLRRIASAVVWAGIDRVALPHPSVALSPDPAFYWPGDERCTPKLNERKREE